MLVAFAELRRKIVLISLRTYVRPSTLTIRLLLGGFHIFTLGNSSKICREISGFIKILGRIINILHKHLRTFIINLTQCFLELELFQTNLYRKSKQNFIPNNFFPETVPLKR
jgi:hypothetical protein